MNPSLKISDTEIIYFPVDKIGPCLIFRLDEYSGIRYNGLNKEIEFYYYNSDEIVEYWKGVKIGVFTLLNESIINTLCRLYKEGLDTYIKISRQFLFKRGLISIIVINLILYLIFQSTFSLIFGTLFGIFFLLYKLVTLKPSLESSKYIVNTIEKFYNEYIRTKTKEETGEGTRN